MPVSHHQLSIILQGHPDAIFLQQGFKEGFHIPHVDLQLLLSIRNHALVRSHATFLREYIQEELLAGRIVGPFRGPPSPTFISSPLGVIPKKESGAFHVIHDLSYPKGRSVNDLIPNSLTFVVYEDFDHVVSLINAVGAGALLAKVDICCAFRILPIHPSCVPLFGFMFDGFYYMDKCLPMGCSFSCALFECFSMALQQVLLSRFGFHAMSHILDDFMFIAPKDSKFCQSQLQCLLQIANFTGIPIKHSKTVYPSTCLMLHGIEVDTIVGQAHLLQDKVVNLLSLLQSFSRKRSQTSRQWQSIIGHLAFASRVVHPGHPYI